MLVRLYEPCRWRAVSKRTVPFGSRLPWAEGLVCFLAAFCSCVQVQAAVLTNKSTNAPPKDALGMVEPLSSDKPAFGNKVLPGLAKSSKPGLFEEMDRIRKKGVLVVATAKEEMRYFRLKNKNTGVDMGIDIDVAKALAKALGVRLRLDVQANSYEEVIERVHQGKADLGISMLSFTPQRAFKVLYTSQPYMQLNAGVVINRLYLAKKGELTLRQLLAQKDAVIGIHHKTSYEDYTKTHFPTAKYKFFSRWDDLAKAVGNGEVSAAFLDNLSVEELLEGNFAVNLQVLPLTLSDEDGIYVVCSPQYPNLPGWIDLVLSNDSTTKMTYEEMKSRYGKGVDK
jgi:polar amino acid transport system substrate-binding protein